MASCENVSQPLLFREGTLCSVRHFTWSVLRPVKSSLGNLWVRTLSITRGLRWAKRNREGTDLGNQRTFKSIRLLRMKDRNADLYRKTLLLAEIVKQNRITELRLKQEKIKHPQIKREIAKMIEYLQNN